MSDFLTAGYEELELSTQMVIKEALNRDIHVTVVDKFANVIKLQKGDRIEYIQQATRTSADSYITSLLMENKNVSKIILQEGGVAAPAGEFYTSVKDALAGYEKFASKDMVIKPNSTNFGIGITILCHPHKEEDYREAVEKAFSHDKSILVEEYISGKEYRFLVMGEKVVGVLHRVPANVVGDGKSTIGELVTIKNKSHLRGKGYKTPLEKITLTDVEEQYLLAQGKSLNSVLKRGEQIFLRKNSNVSTGGDSIDYTDDVLEEYKDIAVQSARAVGAKICGADIIIKDIKEKPTEGNYSVIEINFNPALHIHGYPYRGKNRHPEKKLLDLLGLL